MPDISLPAVSIVDYGRGNLFSVKQACEQAGLRPVITASASVIADSDALILPGVGAFGDAMESLQKMDLGPAIRDFIASGRPFMGICLGMQLLMNESNEFGIHKGLDIIKGRVIRFPDKDAENKISKVPQVGWNRIFRNHSGGRNGWQGTPLRNVNDAEFMYFVHSYYAVPTEKETVLSTSTYGGMEYCSSILWKNVFAVQFHPEKSSREGIKIYREWGLSFNGKG